MKTDRKTGTSSTGVGASLGLTYAYAELVEAVDLHNVPADVVLRAKLALLDTVGVVAAGASTDMGRAIRHYLGAPERGALSTTGWEAFPTTTTYRSWEDAGFAIGVFAGNDNYHDTSLEAVTHPSSVVVPAVLVASQRSAVGGRRVLEATLAGYEVMETLARQVNGGDRRMALMMRGIRPTGACGPLGAVAAVGKLTAMPIDLMSRAFQLACNHACGLRRTTGDPLSGIRIQSGTAVRLGLASIGLARSGVSGDPMAIEGPSGFLDAFGGDRHAHQRPEGALAGEGAWVVGEMSIKLHCTPQTMATALDCLLDLVEQHDVVPESVVSVEIRLPSQHVAISGNPYRRFETYGEAAGNMAHCAASVMVSRDYMWARSLRSLVGNDRVDALARKVDLVADPAITEDYKAGRAAWPASVKVVLADGTVLLARADAPRGIEASEATQLAIRRKLEMLSEDSDVPIEVERLTEFVMALEDCDDFYGELRALTPSGELPDGS